MIELLCEEEEIWMQVTYHIHESLMKNQEPEYKTPGGLKKALKGSNLVDWLRVCLNSNAKDEI